MQLGRYSVSTLRASPIHSIHFSQDGAFFSVASETGYEVWRSYPLGLVRRRELGGTLAVALPLPYSPLLVLQGGGNDPLYSPNKAIIYHDEQGIAVAQLEFSERIRGVTCRHGTLCIALSHRVIAFQYGIEAGSSRPGDAGPSSHMDDRGRFSLRKLGQWETSENEQGLMALSTMPGSTLLALPGRQAGHVQLIQLPPCPSPKSASASSPGPSNPKSQGFRSPIILAHTHPLSTLTCTPSGSHIITTSERGTLLRVWDTARGQLQRELRRGVDRAEMWGARFEPPDSEIVGGKGGRVVGWSDKGTMHIWDDETNPLRDGSTSTSTTTPPSLTNLLSRNIPLPKYFSSTASVAQYHLPRKNPHAFASVVGAAAGKAGMTTKSSSEEVDGDGEWSERFVVGWIRVELGAEASGGVGEKEGGNRHGKTSVDFTTARGGAHLGSREERRSFGSETPSSRTATPTPFSKGAFIPSRTETPPTPRAQRRSSAASTVSAGGAGTSANMHSTSTTRSTRPTSSNPTGPGAKGEMQLVAITYSGDWYRLRIPQDDEAGQRGKCELVEYRRLGVGGGGW